MRTETLQGKRTVVVVVVGIVYDLVKGKYEGGLKLWECAIDLTEYLVRERVVEEMVSKSSKTKPFQVLELGSYGHGVPGIASLMVHKKIFLILPILFCAR